MNKRNQELERVTLQLQRHGEIADSHKIELVARDTEIGSLSDKLSEYRRDQKDLRHLARETELESKALRRA